MLQYLIMFACMTAQGGCITSAPPIPDDASYANTCLAMAMKDDGSIDDSQPQGQCSIEQDGGAVLVTVKGNADSYYVVLSVSAQDETQKQ